jgi:hypothetical protein
MRSTIRELENQARLVLLPAPKCTWFADPTQSSPYRFMTLLDTTGNLYDILLTRILRGASERGTLSVVQVGFRAGHRKTLQQARLTDNKFDKRRLICVIFLHMAKASNTV